MGSIHNEVTTTNPSPEHLELSTHEANLCRAIRLISSLVVHSHSIKVFHVKWQQIRNKLEELNSGLTAVKNCCHHENETFSDLVLEILATVSDCNALARRCTEFSQSGKLLMQSDVNVVSAKLEVHLKKLAGIYSAGILCKGYEIVVLRPGVGASRDDMKFYVEDLLTRMKIGGSDMKREAITVLSEVVAEDKYYVRAVVEMEQLVALLVNFIEFENSEIQEKSVNVVTSIAELGFYQGVLVGAGVIAPLIQVLVSGSDRAKEEAARCLQKLTQNSENAWSVSSHGGVAALLKICTDTGSKPELICSVCGVLKNLSGVEEIKRYMVQEGVVPAYIKLLRFKDGVVQVNAIVFLQVLASKDELILQVFVKEGGIPLLVSMLDPKTAFSPKARKTALEAIESVCFASKNSLTILRGCRFLNKLLCLLCNNELLLQESAVKAVLHLCQVSDETKKAMGDTGFMSVLLTLLDTKCFQIRETAAEALAMMLKVPRNRRRFMEDDCSAGRILQMLDPSAEKLGNTKFLLSSLMSLTSSNSGRRKIAASSHLVNLEKLAEGEVVEAKKIMKNLSANRFRLLLDGIWHT